MVVVEEAVHGDGGPEGGVVGEFASFVVTGAGWDDANGLYLPTGKVWHSAPVYENDQKCLLSREPHKNQKTGETSYGWILGQDRKPLYAIQTDSLLPPASGWRKFSGTLPVPQIQGKGTAAEGAQAAAQAWKEQGNGLFALRRYEEAEAKWTRALQLSSQLDALLQVALHSNRAEARLRLQKWEAALGDARAALRHKPTHDKALLRAAVAARELRRYDLAQEFVVKCLDAHPRQPEARQLLMDLEHLIEQERKEYPDRASVARQKLRESMQREAEAEEGELSAIPRAFSAKDVNSKVGFKAFEGYSDRRKATEEKPPLSALPYHHMGLPKEQVELMDNFFKDMRERKAEKERKDRLDQEQYQRIKAEYRERAQEDLAMGKLEPLEQLLPSEKARKQLQGVAGAERHPEALASTRAALQVRKQAERVQLSQADREEIDALFAPYVGVQASRPSSDTVALTEEDRRRRERLEKAKASVSTAGAQPAAPRDGATAGDREERQERRLAAERMVAGLESLRTSRRGEPTRFEQAASEVYCWWQLPDGVSGRDIKVTASQGGQWLTVTVRDVVIFDRKLFQQIRVDDIVWSVEDGELHLTLTKGEKNKLWEQLGEVSEVRRDGKGRVIPESVPEPLSSTDRLDKFRQMVSGDDGTLISYEDLDAEGRRLVDTIRRFEHARATGNVQELAEAEMDLEEFGRFVV